ncbi:MAG: ABC transporter permease subunit, partial [Gammaproteobacteria bacterium]
MSIHHIAGRELHSLFVLPLAWLILATVQLILAVIFFYRLYVFVQFQPRLAGLENPPGLTDLVVAPLLGTAGSIVLLIAPLLTMRLISEERRAGTLQLLLSSPISMAEIILGKYLGLLGFFLIMIAMITLMPLSLLLGGYLDIGQFLAGLLGLTLLVATFCAVGLFMSTLTA